MTSDSKAEFANRLLTAVRNLKQSATADQVVHFVEGILESTAGQPMSRNPKYEIELPPLTEEEIAEAKAGFDFEDVVREIEKKLNAA